MSGPKQFATHSPLGAPDINDQDRPKPRHGYYTVLLSSVYAPAALARPAYDVLGSHVGETGP